MTIRFGPYRILRDEDGGEPTGGTTTEDQVSDDTSTDDGDETSLSTDKHRDLLGQIRKHKDKNNALQKRLDALEAKEREREQKEAEERGEFQKLAEIREKERDEALQRLEMAERRRVSAEALLAAGVDRTKIDDARTLFLTAHGQDDIESFTDAAKGFVEAREYLRAPQTSTSNGSAGHKGESAANTPTTEIEAELDKVGEELKTNPASQALWAKHRQLKDKLAKARALSKKA